MPTRRDLLIDSLKFAGMLAGAALVTGCGESSSTPGLNTPSAQQEAETKKALEARERYEKEKKTKK